MKICGGITLHIPQGTTTFYLQSGKIQLISLIQAAEILHYLDVVSKGLLLALKAFPDSLKD